MRVCFFGDALTVGVGDPTGGGWVGRVLQTVAADRPGLTGYNLGVRRRTTPELLAAWSAEAQPRFQHVDGYGVVIAIGAEDTLTMFGGARVPIEGSLLAFKALLSEVRGAHLPAFVVGPAPTGDAHRGDLVRVMSKQMSAVCAHSGVGFTDLFTTLSHDQWRAAVQAADGEYPDSDGYDRVALAVEPTFRTWLGQLS